MEKYLDRSGKAMLAATLTYDHARSAEKMTECDCVGEDNIAWKEGPYLSSGANEKQIDRDRPYCSRNSNVLMEVAAIVLGPNPPKSSNGGVKIPLPPKDKHESRVEPVIAKLAIIEQFELFKEFLVTFNGPYNQKLSKEWEGRVSQELLEDVTWLINRRNELTHDSQSKLPSMDEAVDCFYAFRILASKLYKAQN